MDWMMSFELGFYLIFCSVATTPFLLETYSVNGSKQMSEDKRLILLWLCGTLKDNLLLLGAHLLWTTRENE